MGRILNNSKVVLCGNPFYLFHVAQLTIKVDRDDRLRFLSNRSLNEFSIDIACFLLNIHKNRLCPSMEYCICGGTKTHWRGNHFIPRPNPKGKKTHVKSCGAACEAYGKVFSYIKGKLL